MKPAVTPLPGWNCEKPTCGSPGSLLTAVTWKAMCSGWCCHKTGVFVTCVCEVKGLLQTCTGHAMWKERNFCWIKPLRWWDRFLPQYNFVYSNTSTSKTYLIHHLKIIYSLSMANFLDHKVFEIRTLPPSLNNPTPLFLKDRSIEKTTVNEL